MAQSYAAVLQTKSIDFQVIGRTNTSAITLQNATSKQVINGGIDAALTVLNAPIYASYRRYKALKTRLCSPAADKSRL